MEGGGASAVGGGGGGRRRRRRGRCKEETKGEQLISHETPSNVTILPARLTPGHHTPRLQDTMEGRLSAYSECSEGRTYGEGVGWGRPRRRRSQEVTATSTVTSAFRRTSDLPLKFGLGAALLLLLSAVAAQDSRCYLSQGGSVENFFVRESLAVGSHIGTLRLEGDASEDGDIYLRLKERDTSVRISENSKNLTLTRKLDKEGKEGESQVTVNVICDRRGTTDPSITIPVNIRVTDDNDNAPIFVNSPYYVNVSEVTVVGTIIMGDILAEDADQQGPFSTVQYSIQEGPYSDMFSFESPLSGSLVLEKPLDYESLPLFNITIVAQDQAAVPQSSTTVLTVQVQDADDQNPAFTRDHYMAVLPENPVKGTTVEIQPEGVSAVDRDEGIMAPVYYSFSREEEEAAWFSIDPESGAVSLAQDLPPDQLSQPTTLVVRATQVDNPDRYALTTVTLSRRGYHSTQLQFIQREYVATVLENLPRHSIIAPTLINKNIDEDIKFSLERNGEGVFRISPSGQILLDHELDYEATQEYNLKVYVTDGNFNDTATLKVQVLNINDWDPRFRYPQYEFFISSTSLKPGDVVGNVQVADGDRGDLITLTVMGQDAQMFTIGNDGELRIRDLTSLNSTEAHIVVTARDSGVPPRMASAPVTVNFPAGMVKSSPLGTGSSFLLIIIFGTLLGVFILIIICLAIYIHKNKKYRDDNNAALPTKMSQIVTNGNLPHTKLDPLSPLNHQMQGNGRQMTPLGSPTPPSGLTGVELPTSDNNNIHTTNNNNYNNGSIRASTISVRSGSAGHSSYKSPRNPLSMGGSLAASSSGSSIPPPPPMVDGVSLSGTVRSSSTTASTASLDGTPEPTPHSARSYYSEGGGGRSGSGRSTGSLGVGAGALAKSPSPMGSARAQGGLPARNRISPAPPTPANTPYPDPPSSPEIITTKGPLGSKVSWPDGSIPKRVKKLSWEDELSTKTELDPEVSVTPMPHSASSSHSSHTPKPKLTVYF